MKNPKILLFDLDGTLVRTGGAGIRALTRTFRDFYQIDNPLKGVTVAGNTDPSIFREVMALHASHINLTQEIERQLHNAYLNYLKQEIPISEKYQVLPGIFEILKKASAFSSLFVGLGTGNFEEGARIKLERGGLNSYFVFGGFGSDALNRDEVLKIGVAKAEERFGIQCIPENVFVIGDTPRDIQSARAIGARVIAVATGGYESKDLKAFHPDCLFENLSDVRQFFAFIEKDDQ